MRMHVYGINGHLGRTARSRFTENELTHHEGIKCEGEVFVKQAFIDYDISKGTHRPHLRLLGEVKSVTGNFPHGVREAVFGESRFCPKVDYRFEFDNSELALLCEKGLFDVGFMPPDKIIDNILVLPLTCSCNALITKNSDIPLLFIGVDNQYDMQTSYAQSGYPIATYFEQLTVDLDDELLDAFAYDDMESDELLLDDSMLSDKNNDALKPITPDAVRNQQEIEEEEALQSVFKNIQARVDEKLSKEKEFMLVDHSEKDEKNDADKHDYPDVPFVDRRNDAPHGMPDLSDLSGSDILSEHDF